MLHTKAPEKACESHLQSDSTDKNLPKHRAPGGISRNVRVQKYLHQLFLRTVVFRYLLG